MQSRLNNVCRRCDGVYPRFTVQSVKGWKLWIDWAKVDWNEIWNVDWHRKMCGINRLILGSGFSRPEWRLGCNPSGGWVSECYRGGTSPRVVAEKACPTEAGVWLACAAEAEQDSRAKLGEPGEAMTGTPWPHAAASRRNTSLSLAVDHLCRFQWWTATFCAPWPLFLDTVQEVHFPSLWTNTLSYLHYN